MRKTPPRTNKMEPTAPKVLSRYLSAPSVSCHDHCKGGRTKEPITETKPISSFLRRIPKPPQERTKLERSNSLNKIRKAPSVVPKITTRNVKNNNNVVKDPNLKKEVPFSTKKGVAIEPKSRDLKPKSENSQSKKNNLPSSRRRHSDIFLPNEDAPLPSSRVPKRRLSEIGIRPKKDASVSNTSQVRGSRFSNNEPRKDSKLSSVNKKSNPIKPTVPSPKRGAKVPTLRSYKSLPQSELQSLRKSKPKKPIEEVVPENTLHAVEPNNGVETSKTESHITPDSSPTSEEKVMTHVQNVLQECLPTTEDDTTVTDGEHNESTVEDSEDIDIKETSRVENLVVETRDCSLDGLQESSPTVEDDITVTDEKHNDSVGDSEEIDIKESTRVDKLVEETSDCSLNGLQECSPPMEDDTTTATDGAQNDNIVGSEVIDTKEATHIEKLVVETRDFLLEDLVFRKGTVLSPQSEGSSPRNMQFRQGKELDENQTLVTQKMNLRRFSTDGIIRDVPESHSVNVELKHQEIAEKENPSLSNDVIEETAKKLIEIRKSKVKALVGAFENIVSASNKSP